MPLAPGVRIGPYEVIAPLGAGGMGEVYRARDERLQRDVALKIVTSRFVLDPGRLDRFAREAHVLASLNHPNIATVHGVEEADGAQVLVLELVEGQTLADRLAAEPSGLRLQEAVTIAQQLAAGLEAAHESGIVHRDLKPANIAIRPDGAVKLLDFGLAKALDPAAGGHDGATITAGETRLGTVLGTPAYMSPEQARGQTVDKRTDVWSFGCVLYEMLTGRATFEGLTTSDTIAAVLNVDPDWRRLPNGTPAAVRTLLRRCLQRDPRQRLRDIGDARIELDSIAAHTSSSGGESDDEPRSRTQHRWTRRHRLALAGAAVGLIALTLAAATWFRPNGETAAEPVHMTALLPPGVTVTRGPGMLLSLALSPDGRTLVIAGTDPQGQRLYARRLDRPAATPLAGTEGAQSAFFSPDGQWIGFFADRRLKRVPAGGGAAVDITAVMGFPTGASWGTDGRIVFATGVLSPLRIVDAAGGTSEPLTPLEVRGHLYPEILPDGRTVLFNEGPWIRAFDLIDRRLTGRLVQGTAPRYATSGHLIFSRGTTLLAAPFDPARLELTGPVAPIVESVAIERGAGGAPHFAVSRAGTLAYVPAAEEYALVLVQPDGTERVLSEDPLLENPRFSPDGRRLVVARTRRADEVPELWLYDLEGARPPSRLTFDGGRAPVWAPDLNVVTYSRPVQSEGPGIYSRSADGGDNARQIVPLSSFHWLVGWTPQRTLAFGRMEDPAADGISRSSILAVAEGREPRRVVGPGDTWGGRLSPDGRWLAYYSLETGYFEIYVTPFPDGGARSQIAEGTDPSWSPDGSEIYYRSGTRLMAARVQTASGVSVLSRRVVTEPFSPPLYDDFDVHPDGVLALVRPVGDAGGREVFWVLNWLEELGRPGRN